MPQLPPVPGVTRVVMQYLMDGQICNNVLHYAMASGVGTPAADTLVQRILTAYGASCRVARCSGAVLSQIIATELDEEGAPSYEFAVTTNGAGAGTACTPNNVSVATSFRTALRGRSYRGRAFWIGVVANMVTGNTLTSTGRNGIRDCWNALRYLEGATGEAGPFQLVVVSYHANNAPRANPVVTPVLTTFTEAIVDSQRRRLPGRGR